MMLNTESAETQDTKAEEEFIMKNAANVEPGLTANQGTCPNVNLTESMDVDTISNASNKAQSYSTGIPEVVSDPISIEAGVDMEEDCSESNERNSTFVIEKESCKECSDDDMEDLCNNKGKNSTFTIEKKSNKKNEETDEDCSENNGRNSTFVIEKKSGKGDSDDQEEGSRCDNKGKNSTFTVEKKSYKDNLSTSTTSFSDLEEPKTETIEDGVDPDLKKATWSVSDSDPSVLMMNLQTALTSYVTQKRQRFDEMFEREEKKAKARYERVSLGPTHRRSETPVRAPSTTDVDAQQAIRDRDFYKNQLASSDAAIKNLYEQHQIFINKEQAYREEFAHLIATRDDYLRSHDAITVRYNELFEEVQAELMSVDDTLDHLAEKHEDDLATLRFKVRKDEMELKSLEQAVDTLGKEKKELLDICDDLVARSEKTHIMS